MPDHFQTIYAGQADSYDRLVAREDYQGNLLPALNAICSLAGLDVIEFGAGTGRLTRLLAPHVQRICAFDLSHHMLSVGRDTLPEHIRGRLAVGDNRRMPVRAACADLVIAGWSFGHLVGWTPDHWQAGIGAALAEMQRILRPGGVAVILETLGTGSAEPHPPTDGLAAYYAWLEAQGWSATWARTDYRFASLDEADALTRFFFGDALADRVRHDNLVILPECTGLWWRAG